MERYYLPKELDFDNLRLCLDNHEAYRLFIRRAGYKGGAVKVDERLEGKKLDFTKDENGLSLLIDSSEVFQFPLKDYDKSRQWGLILAYERFAKDAEGKGSRLPFCGGRDPYDPSLPEPLSTVLRHDLDDHVLEIYFNGRIGLKFHSDGEWPQTKFWTVAEKGK
jgi:hypothetical protein